MQLQLVAVTAPVVVFVVIAGQSVQFVNQVVPDGPAMKAPPPVYTAPLTLLYIIVPTVTAVKATVVYSVVTLPPPL